MTKRARDPQEATRDAAEDATTDDAAAFAEAVRGARKLGGPRPVSPEFATPPSVRPVPRSAPAPAPARALLSVEEAGERWTARAEGVDRRILRKLRDGQMPVEGRIDLHGLTRARAGDALDRFLTTSRAAGRRCLLVIHGRGLHSGEDGPALRDAVRELLTMGGSAAAVLACTSAAAAQGGPGATLVYLRR